MHCLPVKSRLLPGCALLLSLPFSCLAIFCLTISCLALAAEEDTLLTISGNLISEIPGANETADPVKFIDDYYALLSQQDRSAMEQLRRQLGRRWQDYAVAFTAADTAEINETLDDLSLYWASLRTLHAQAFSPEVFAALSQAYGEIYSFIAEASGQ